jgi:hypothetical protein
MQKELTTHRNGRTWKENFKSFHTAIFKPTVSLGPVLQPAKFTLWMRNRGDAIIFSEELKAYYDRFYWNKI